MEPNIKTLKIDNVKGKTLTKYNEFTKNLILQIKARYDLALATVILMPFKHALKQIYRGYHLVHVPSSSKSDKTRGFNHVKVIFQLLELPQLDVFEKANNYKQAKRSINKREEISKAIKLKSNVILPPKILLVDDIVTSGASLTTCLELLKQQKVKRLAFLVFADNCRNIRQKRYQIKTKLEDKLLK